MASTQKNVNVLFWTFYLLLNYIQISTAERGGKVSLKESHLAVHKSIMQDSELMGALIHECGLVPTLLPSRHRWVYLPENFYGIVTPFLQAITLGNARLAQSMIDIRYLRVSDLTVLPATVGLPDLQRFEESRQILNDLATTPPSLMTLTFAHVSDMLGASKGGDQRDKVRQLGLPRRLQDALAFVPTGSSGRIFTDNFRCYQHSDSESSVDSCYDDFDTDFLYNDC